MGACDVFLNNPDRMPCGNMWINQGNQNNLFFEVKVDARLRAGPLGLGRDLLDMEFLDVFVTNICAIDN